MRGAGQQGGSDLEHRFRELVHQWKQGTEFTSSTTQMVTHPAYQQVIGMGRPVLPLLVAELRRKPDHWFWALKGGPSFHFPSLVPRKAGKVFREGAAPQWMAACLTFFQEALHGQEVVRG